MIRSAYSSIEVCTKEARLRLRGKRSASVDTKTGRREKNAQRVRIERQLGVHESVRIFRIDSLAREGVLGKGFVRAVTVGEGVDRKGLRFLPSEHLVDVRVPRVVRLGVVLPSSLEDLLGVYMARKGHGRGWLYDGGGSVGSEVEGYECV
jgi:hypothetical protein